MNSIIGELSRFCPPSQEIKDYVDEFNVNDIRLSSLGDDIPPFLIPARKAKQSTVSPSPESAGGASSAASSGSASLASNATNSLVGIKGDLRRTDMQTLRVSSTSTPRGTSRLASARSGRARDLKTTVHDESDLDAEPKISLTLRGLALETWRLS